MKDEDEEEGKADFIQITRVPPVFTQTLSILTQRHADQRAHHPANQRFIAIATFEHADHPSERMLVGKLYSVCVELRVERHLKKRERFVSG